MHAATITAAKAHSAVAIKLRPGRFCVLLVFASSFMVLIIAQMRICDKWILRVLILMPDYVEDLLSDVLHGI